MRRVDTRDIEIEGYHRDDGEQVLDEPLGAGARHRSPQPTDAMQQLGSGDRRDRELSSSSSRTSARSSSPRSRAMSTLVSISVPPDSCELSVCGASL